MSNIKLNLKMDGTTTSFTDSSASGHTVTANGNTTQIATKFRPTCLLLDGDSDYIQVPDHADFDIGTNFTIDLWVKHDDHVGTEMYASQYVDATNYWKFEHIHGTGLHFQVDGGNADINISGGEIADTNWHHVAICKVAGDVGLYLDGTQTANGDSVCTTTHAGDVFIGASGVPGDYFDGYARDIRISNNNRFSAAPNATPDDTITVPSGKPSSDSNVKLLIHGDSNFPVPVVGTAEFNGTDMYLSAADHANWDIGTNWTIDAWVKHDDHVGTEVYVSQYKDADEYWLFEHIDATGIHFQVDGGGADINISGGEITDTNWHHVAVCKVGSDVGLYKDGIQVEHGSAACTTDLVGGLYVGASGVPGNYFDGNMTYVRVSKSNIFTAAPAADDSDRIDVPRKTTDYSVTTNTSLRLKTNAVADSETFTDTGTTAHTITNNNNLIHRYINDHTLLTEVDESASGHFLEFKGTTQVTWLAVHGAGVAYFDGNGDFLEMADHADWCMAGGNFTWEAWIKPTAQGTLDAIICQGSDANNYVAFRFDNTAATSLEFYSRVADTLEVEVDGAHGMSSDIWYHVALIRGWSGNANDYAITVNGHPVATGTDTYTHADVAFKMGIGYDGEGAGNGAGYFNGYMDRVRITKGTARWTAAFKPPQYKVLSPQAIVI